MGRIAGIALVAALAAGACSRAPEPRQYEVKGQILRIDPERREVLVSHEDIPGFMAAMTMPYRVRDAALLEGKEPGDLFTATLVVEEVDAYLSTLTRTGHAPIETPPAGPILTAADLLEEGDTVPDHVLVDQDRIPRLMVSLRGHRVALTFMYTRCPLPDFCPRMDRNFVEVQKAVAEAPELADVRLVSVTLDPEVDTPDVLKAHAQRVGADPRRWHFVTGDREEVLSFAKRFGVTAEPPGAPGDMLVHNLRTAVIDPDGRLVSVRSGNMWTPAELVADLQAAPAPAN
ncbi:MAG: SCO family protein [Acidobacteria bacterium]|nr:SCO family protein [Acidobacteriota bacterium]